MRDPSRSPSSTSPCHSARIDPPHNGLTSRSGSRSAPRDVGEEKRHRPGRKLGPHAAILLAAVEAQTGGARTGARLLGHTTELASRLGADYEEGDDVERQTGAR